MQAVIKPQSKTYRSTINSLIAIKLASLVYNQATLNNFLVKTVHFN